MKIPTRRSYLWPELLTDHGSNRLTRVEPSFRLHTFVLIEEGCSFRSRINRPHTGAHASRKSGLQDPGSGDVTAADDDSLSATPVQLRHGRTNRISPFRRAIRGASITE